MNTHLPGSDRIDALLSEHAASGPAERAALRDLLSAAGSPALPGELRGEAAALSAFRSATNSSSVAARSRPAMTRRIATAFSVKALAVTVALTGMGGVALAATTGALPGPLDGPKHKTQQVEQKRTSDDPKRAGDANGAEVAHRTDKAAALRSRSSDHAIAAFGRLCRSYDNGDFADRTRPAQARAFQRLVTAAGGDRSVQDFCATVAAIQRDAKNATDDGDQAPGSGLGKGNSDAGSGHGGSGGSGNDNPGTNAGEHTRDGSGSNSGGHGQVGSGQGDQVGDPGEPGDSGQDGSGQDTSGDDGSGQADAGSGDGQDD